jgi:hypothetical protein
MKDVLTGKQHRVYRDVSFGGYDGHGLGEYIQFA